MNLAPRQFRPATRADLDELPPTWRGEVIDGELYAFPRPAAPHSHVETSVAADLSGPFQRGREGPGGWWILAEPELGVFGGEQVIRAAPFDAIEIALEPWWEGIGHDAPE